MKAAALIARWTLLTVIGLRSTTTTQAQTPTADSPVPPSVIYVGATNLDPTGRSPTDVGFGIDLNEQLDSDTAIKVSYMRGANPGIVRAFRYGLHKSRFHASFEHGAWTLAGGEIRFQRRLFGAPIVGDGFTFAHNGDTVVGSLSVTRPKHFAGHGGGHLFEGSLGLKRGGVTVRGFASDVARTSLHFSPITSIQLPKDDSELTLTDLAQLGQLITRANRVRTGGVDTQFLSGPHTFIARAALIEQLNDAGTERRGIAAEGNYSFASPRALLTASIRRLPTALPGIQLPGHAATISTKIKINNTIKTSARAVGTEVLAFGRVQPTRTLGGAGGIELGKGAARMEVLGNYRDARTTTFRRSRTISSSFRLPAGRLTAEGRMEFGQADVNGRSHRIAAYRASLHIDADPTAIIAGVTYQDYGTSPARTRIDMSASTEWQGVLAEIGVGAGKSQLFGDDFGLWINVDVPLPAAIMLNVGVNYERWLYETSRYVTFVPNAHDLESPWRVTVSLSKHLALFPRQSQSGAGISGGQFDRN